MDPHSGNSTLSDALKRIDLAERTGRGVHRIYEESLAYGKPLPDYSQSSETTVKLFIPLPLKSPAEFSVQVFHVKLGIPLGASPVAHLVICKVYRIHNEIAKASPYKPLAKRPL